MSTHPRTARYSRRAFGGIAMSGAVAINRPVMSDEPERNDGSPKRNGGWIDAHVHVWSPDVERYPLADGYKQADMRPPSFTASELFRHCRPEGVSRIVLIQMSFYRWDHRYLFEAMDEHPNTFSAVALIDHRAKDVVVKAGELAKRGARGFRLHSRGDAKDWGNSATMAQLWTFAAKEGLAVCPLINPEDIPIVDALCARFPDTTVVVDHFARIGISGRIEANRLEHLCRLARYPNVHVKTSAFYALGKKTPPYDDLMPMIRRVVDAFGVERLMWASDCPFQVQGQHSYGESIALIRDRADFLSSSDKSWLLRGTAEKVFFSDVE